MADEDKPKRTVNRQKGGFALVEVLPTDEGRRLEVLVSDLDGQKEVKDELKKLIKDGDVKGDGGRTFGIIQIKELALCPQVETKVSF